MFFGFSATFFVSLPTVPHRLAHSLLSLDEILDWIVICHLSPTKCVTSAWVSSHWCVLFSDTLRSCHPLAGRHHPCLGTWHPWAQLVLWSLIGETSKPTCDHGLWAWMGQRRARQELSAMGIKTLLNSWACFLFSMCLHPYSFQHLLRTNLQRFANLCLVSFQNIQTVPKQKTPSSRLPWPVGQAKDWMERRLENALTEQRSEMNRRFGGFEQSDKHFKAARKHWVIECGLHMVAWCKDLKKKSCKERLMSSGSIYKDNIL